MKEHINDKFDLLKYYKRYNHYKFIKKIILSDRQREVLKKLNNFKSNFMTIYKSSKKDYFNEEERDIQGISLQLKNHKTDQRIKKLIDLYTN